jgi:hypothetical protein
MSQIIDLFEALMILASKSLKLPATTFKVGDTDIFLLEPSFAIHQDTGVRQ